MTEFLLGFTIGSLVVGIIATPFLMFFGITYLNVRRMEKQMAKEMAKPLPTIQVDEDVAKTVYEAEKLISKNISH